MEQSWQKNITHSDITNIQPTAELVEDPFIKELPFSKPINTDIPSSPPIKKQKSTQTQQIQPPINYPSTPYQIPGLHLLTTAKNANTFFVFLSDAQNFNVHVARNIECACNYNHDDAHDE